MRLILIWILSLQQLFSYSQPPMQIGSGMQRAEWKAANYRGIVVGKSSITEALKLFGKPKSISLEADHDVSDPNRPLHYSYRALGEYREDITVIVDKKNKRILEILISPYRLTRGKAITRFGHDYIEKRYSFCPDVDNTTAPIFEDPHGDILQIEYPHKSIILSVNDENEISEIAYVSDSLALESESKCKMRR